MLKCVRGIRDRLHAQREAEREAVAVAEGAKQAPWFGQCLCQSLLQISALLTAARAELAAGLKHRAAACAGVGFWWCWA